MRLGAQLEQLLDASARTFHFHVGDGHFVDEIMMGPIVLESISGLVHDRGGMLDCHLMVSQPARHFDQVRSAGADSVTFHMEAVDDPVATIAAARELGLAVGVALNPGTPLDEAILAGQSADLVLCMGIQPGLSVFMSRAPTCSSRGAEGSGKRISRSPTPTWRRRQPLRKESEDEHNGNGKPPDATPAP